MYGIVIVPLFVPFVTQVAVPCLRGCLHIEARFRKFCIPVDFIVGLGHLERQNMYLAEFSLQ
jgi:hypothetical protein